MFAVGKLEEFSPKLVRTEDVIDKLHSTQCFRNVSKEFVQKLKFNFHTFISRMDTAAKGSDESYWHSLCNEPKSKLKGLWKVKKESGKGPKSDEQKREESEKNLMQAMYYCLYIVLFWRHENSSKRYKAHVRSIEDFQSSYEKDVAFPRERMDKWETLFNFRNVMILAAAIKPSLRNKGLFSKLGCILAEDRIHSMGGGQSFAADRRGRIYDTEGSVYAAAPLVLYNKVDFQFEQFVPLVKQEKLVDCATHATPGPKKHKRRTSDGSNASCVPPTLSRTNSLNPRVKKHSRDDPNSIIDLDAELDFLLDHGDFTDGDYQLMRNMSLGQLCEAVDNEDVASGSGNDNGHGHHQVVLPAVSINLHQDYVVGRAFSYNAYAYNNHVDTPLLGAEAGAGAGATSNLEGSAPVGDEASNGPIDYLVDVDSSSCAIDFGAMPLDLLSSDNSSDNDILLMGGGEMSCM